MRPTSTPGARRSASAIFVAPERRICSLVMTYMAAGVLQRSVGILLYVVTLTLANCSRVRCAKYAGPSSGELPSIPKATANGVRASSAPATNTFLSRAAIRRAGKLDLESQREPVNCGREMAGERFNGNVILDGRSRCRGMAVFLVANLEAGSSKMVACEQVLNFSPRGGSPHGSFPLDREGAGGIGEAQCFETLHSLQPTGDEGRSKTIACAGRVDLFGR